MKQPKINDEVKLTLKFRVEEVNEQPLCDGCFGEHTSRYKCALLRETFGSCFGKHRPDNKDVIYKLIEKQ